MQSGRSSIKSSEERASSIIEPTSTRLQKFQTNLSSLPRYGISSFVWNVYKFYTRLHGVTSINAMRTSNLITVNETSTPCDIFPTRCNIRQSIYFWKIALHVSGGISTHHQEHTQLYLQHLVLVKPLRYLPLSWKSWNWFECGAGVDLFWCGCVSVIQTTQFIFNV